VVEVGWMPKKLGRRGRVVPRGMAASECKQRGGEVGGVEFMGCSWNGNWRSGRWLRPTAPQPLVRFAPTRHNMRPSCSPSCCSLTPPLGHLVGGGQGLSKRPAAESEASARPGPPVPKCLMLPGLMDFFHYLEHP
jgi:hypothetical protein